MDGGVEGFNGPKFRDSGSFPRAVSCVRVAVRWQLSLVTFRPCSPPPATDKPCHRRNCPTGFVVQRRSRDIAITRKATYVSVKKQAIWPSLVGSPTCLGWLFIGYPKNTTIFFNFRSASTILRPPDCNPVCPCRPLRHFFSCEFRRVRRHLWTR
ncbi:hypothetical protein LY76DRAFT_18544 [Colletotrichum caudatum]|nr:hypothetical protein LY76DRAFT_18544 [Colletotrichum caudatum]